MRFETLRSKKPTQHFRDGFSLELEGGYFPKGQISALVGGNGCGKTSLLRSLVGLDGQDFSGSIFYQDEPISADREKWSRELAWIPQNQNLSFDLSVHAFALLGLYPWHKGRPKPADLALCQMRLESLNLSSKLDRSLSTLSTGERQACFLARGLTTRAQVLIFDEPCAI